MKTWGGALIGIGLVVMIGAALFPTTVEVDSSAFGGGSNQVYNLGALQFQELAFWAGIALFLAGVILFSTGELIECLVRAGTAETRPFFNIEPAPSETNVCTWCERQPERGATCDAVPPERLQAVADAIVDSTCKMNLRERGFLSE